MSTYAPPGSPRGDGEEALPRGGKAEVPEDPSPGAPGKSAGRPRREPVHAEVVSFSDCGESTPAERKLMERQTRTLWEQTPGKLIGTLPRD